MLWISTFLLSNCEKVKMLVALSCPTLCDARNYSPPGSSVHGILQARILEWVTIPFSRGSSWPKDRIQVSCNAGRFLTIWATRLGGFFLEAEKKGNGFSPWASRRNQLCQHLDFSSVRLVQMPGLQNYKTKRINLYCFKLFVQFVTATTGN